MQSYDIFWKLKVDLLNILVSGLNVSAGERLGRWGVGWGSPEMYRNDKILKFIY